MASVLGRALNFLLLPLYIHFLTREQYGVLSLLFLIQVFTNLLPDAVFILPLFRSFYDYPEDDQHHRSLVVSTSFWLICASAAVVCGAGWLLASPLSSLILKSPLYASSVQLVFLTCFLQSIGLPSFAVFRAQKRSGAYAAIATVAVVVNVLLSFLFVIAFHWDVWGIMLANLIGIALRTALGLLSTRNVLSLRFSRLEAHKMIAYGLPLVPGQFLGYCNRSSDTWFISYYISFAAAGVYSVGLRFGQIIAILLFTPFNFIRPAAIFSAEKDQDAPEFYARMLTYLVFLGLFLTLGVSALVPETLRIIAPSKPHYWNVWPIVPLLCLSYLFDGLRRSCAPGLLIKRKTNLMSIAEAFGTGANLLLMVILVPTIGPLGAAVAVFVTYFVTCFVLFAYDKKYFPVRWEWRRIAKLFIVASFLYALSLLVRLPDLNFSFTLKIPFGPAFLVRFTDLWITFVLNFLLCLTFPLVLLPLRFYEPAELQRLIRLLPRFITRRLPASLTPPSQS